MQVEKQIRDNGLTELTVTITPEEVKQWLDEAGMTKLKNGKVLSELTPEEWKEKKVQDEIKSALLSYGDHAVLDNMTPTPLEDPYLGSQHDVMPNEGFEFEVLYAALPESELDSYKPVKVRVAQFTTSDEEIDERLEEILKGVPCTQEKPEGSVVEAGDTVEISMDATSNGARYEALSSGVREYRLGDNFLPKAFDDALLGLHVGDETTCSFQVEHHDHPGEAPAENEEKTFVPVDVSLKVLRIMHENLQSIDDKFVQQQFPGIGNVKQLRNAVKKSIDEEKQEINDQNAASQVISELVNRIHVDIPDAIYEAYYAMIVKNFDAQLREEGKTHDDFLKEQDIDEGQFRIDVMFDVRQQFMNAIALDSYARHFKLEPTEKDIRDFLGAVKAQEGMEAVKQIESAPYPAGVKESVRRYMAQQKAIKNADVKYFDA